MSHMRWAALVVLTSFALGAGSASVPPDLKALYDEKKYQQVIDGLSKLSQDAQASPEVRRLKVRTLIKLGTPREALAEYDKLEAGLHQDDVPLLREMALGFILSLVKDMREQMRGAAYTALKEIDSDEAVPRFSRCVTCARESVLFASTTKSFAHQRNRAVTRATTIDSLRR